MPTAVERVAEFLSNILRLDAIDNPGAEAAFPILDGQVDAGIAALGSASTPRDFAGVERTYGAVFAGIGGGAFGLGADLQGDAIVFDVVNILLGGNNAFGGGGGSGTQADFGTLDRALFGAGGDLETFGADFAGLGRVRSQTALATLAGKLQGDGTTLASDFTALGGELTTFVNDLTGGGNGGGVTAAAVTATPSPYAGLIAALTPIEAQFAQIGSDFTSLVAASGGGGGGVVASALSSSGGGGSATPYGAAFANLDTDFLALDKSFQGLGAPLANLLLPAVQTPTTT